jgi:hypothetical protein
MDWINTFLHGDPTSLIDWQRLVEFNSRNYDLDQFLP